MRKRLRLSGYTLLILLLCAGAAELTARLDDWVRNGIPLQANPDAEYNLQVMDASGMIRGRPFGQYKHWNLNEYGFRSPPMSKEPAQGVTRVAVLGASETFGLYESDGKEMAAQLADELGRDDPPVEVVNTSITGMTARSMAPYWRRWVSQFRPRIVVIYSSPLFYLHDWAGQVSSAQAQVASTADSVAGGLTGVGAEPRMGSRFVSHLKDIFHWPDFVQRYRTRQEVERITQGKPADWFFREVPRANLEQYLADLAEIARAVRADGAEAVIVTHALRAGSPPEPADLDDLEALRVHLPRATADVLLAFNEEANTGILELCRKEGFPALDAAASMNGRRELFGDLVHFNDAGASLLARLVAERLRPLLHEARTSEDRPG